MDIDDRDILIGKVCAIVTFLAAWVYCSWAYGFLLGFGIGWLPSLILAAIVFFISAFAWRLFVGVAVLIVVIILWSLRKA
jgi:hypothetical protein